jgi:hypothetical protein
MLDRKRFITCELVTSVEVILSKVNILVKNRVVSTYLWMKGVYSVKAIGHYVLANLPYSKTWTVPCTDKSIGTNFLNSIALVVLIKETHPVNSCKMSEQIKSKQNNGNDHLFYLFIVYCVKCFRQFVLQVLPLRRHEQI